MKSLVLQKKQIKKHQQKHSFQENSQKFIILDFGSRRDTVLKKFISSF